jgi:hypothetical protein
VDSHNLGGSEAEFFGHLIEVGTVLTAIADRDFDHVFGEILRERHPAHSGDDGSEARTRVRVRQAIRFERDEEAGICGNRVTPTVRWKQFCADGFR